jgi:hypothetical protein
VGGSFKEEEKRSMEDKRRRRGRRRDECECERWSINGRDSNCETSSQ